MPSMMRRHPVTKQARHAGVRQTHMMGPDSNLSGPIAGVEQKGAGCMRPPP